MHAYERFDDLDDSPVEDILVHRRAGDRSESGNLALFITRLRSDCIAPMPAASHPELARIFVSGLDPSPASTAPHLHHNATRRRRVFISVCAFVASLTGKIVLGTAAVAAGVSGAHATGIADVPGLPDLPTVVDGVEPDEPDEHAEIPPQQPADPGVDGSEISDRATSGQPQEDGKAFGQSVADEAVDGTPAEELRQNRGTAGQDHRPRETPGETPAGDVPTPPAQPPTSGTDTADDHSTNPPVDRRP